MSSACVGEHARARVCVCGGRDCTGEMFRAYLLNDLILINSRNNF